MTFAEGPTVLMARPGCAALALSQDHSHDRTLVVYGHDENHEYLATTEFLTAAS